MWLILERMVSWQCKSANNHLSVVLFSNSGFLIDKNKHTFLHYGLIISMWPMNYILLCYCIVYQPTFKAHYVTWHMILSTSCIITPWQQAICYTYTYIPQWVFIDFTVFSRNHRHLPWGLDKNKRKEPLDLYTKYITTLVSFKTLNHD